MGQVGIVVGKAVHLFGQAQYAFLGVGGVKRGQLNGAEKELLHVHGVVLGHLVGDDVNDSVLDGLLVDVEVVLSERLLVFVLAQLFAFLFSYVVDNDAFN